MFNWVIHRPPKYRNCQSGASHCDCYKAQRFLFLIGPEEKKIKKFKHLMIKEKIDKKGGWFN